MTTRDFKKGIQASVAAQMYYDNERPVFALNPEVSADMELLRRIGTGNYIVHQKYLVIHKLRCNHYESMELAKAMALDESNEIDVRAAAAGKLSRSRHSDVLWHLGYPKGHTPFRKLLSDLWGPKDKLQETCRKILNKPRQTPLFEELEIRK